MPRSLKTFVTNLGFFEMAIAAPSMKAALEAWGMGHNTFKQGFARQTDDPKIVAAAEAHPGVVLRRAVGSSGEFKEHAELPKSLPAIAPPAIHKPAAQKPPKKSKAKPAPTTKGKHPVAPVVSLVEKRREKEHERKQEVERRRKEARAAKEEARAEKEAKKRQVRIDHGEEAMAAAREEHDATMSDIQSRREELDAEEQKETARWEKERGRLQAAIREAKGLR